MLLTAAAFQANAAVTLTDAGASAPGAGANGISQTDGSGTFSYWLASADRAQGQSFTLGGSHSDVFNLNSFSLLSANSANGENHDKGSYATAFVDGTWNIQIARFDNANSGGFAERTDGPTHSADYLANTTGVSLAGTGDVKQVFTGIANIGAGYTLGDWVTFDFSSVGSIQLAGGYTYEVSFGQAGVGYGNSADFLGSTGDVLANGVAFNAYGGTGFNDNYVHDLGNNGGSGGANADRTFVANISAVTPAPEPTTAALGGLGLVLLGLLKRKNIFTK